MFLIVCSVCMLIVQIILNATRRHNDDTMPLCRESYIRGLPILNSPFVLFPFFPILGGQWNRNNFYLIPME